jgi:kinetochore protein Spc7/SPC105
MKIEDAVRALEVGGITDVQIVSDERLAVESVMLLPTLTTKILVGFEIGVAISATNVEASVDVKANVVYGEKYDETKMADFISKFVCKTVTGKDDMSSWAIAVEDLKGRLLRRGPKGSIA